jgi:hypothetical protein
MNILFGPGTVCWMKKRRRKISWHCPFKGLIIARKVYSGIMKNRTLKERPGPDPDTVDHLLGMEGGDVTGVVSRI